MNYSNGQRNSGHGGWTIAVIGVVMIFLLSIFFITMCPSEKSNGKMTVDTVVVAGDTTVDTTYVTDTLVKHDTTKDTIFVKKPHDNRYGEKHKKGKE